MRHAFLAVVVTLVYCMSASSHASTPLVLELAQAAAGGRSELAKVHSIHATVIRSVYGRDPKASMLKTGIWLGEPARFLERTASLAGGTPKAIGVDGNTLILPDDKLPANRLANVIDAERSEMNRLSLAWLQTPFVGKIAEEGSMKLRGIDVDVIRATGQGFDYRLGYGKNHLLQIIDEVIGGTHSVYETFGYYRSVGKLKLPFARDMFVDGKKIESWQIQEFEINPAAFEKVMTRRRPAA